MRPSGASCASEKENKMSKYLMIFHFTGERPADAAGQAAMGQAWGGWYGSIGPSLVDPGGQCGQASTVELSGASDSSGAVTGFAIVEAVDLDAAVAIAQTNPIVADNAGTIDVAQVIEMG